jgi:hypothetical protein
MNTRIVRNVAVALAAVSWLVAGDLASAQLFRPRVRNSAPVQPVQPAAADQAALQPLQPTQPAQPGQPTQPPQAPGTVMAGGAMVEGGNMVNGTLPRLDPARIVRGSQLVGETILDPRSQKLGVIKDFLIDSQTARVMYVMMAPEPASPVNSGEANAEWIVLPFDDLRLSTNAQGSPPMFILNLPAAQLRAAPHMRSNAWETLRDPRFIGQVQQFYRPTEWTARRMNQDSNGNYQGAPQPGQIPQTREGQGVRPPSQGQPTPAATQPSPQDNRSPRTVPGTFAPPPPAAPGNPAPGSTPPAHTAPQPGGQPGGQPVPHGSQKPTDNQSSPPQTR